MAASILTWPPASIRFFMGVWDPSNQLEAELASNLPRELLKMVEYDMEIENFRFGMWPTASGHGEYIYIYIYMYIYRVANGSVQIANGSVRILNFAGSVPPASEINFAGPKTWDVKTDTAISQINTFMTPARDPKQSFFVNQFRKSWNRNH